MTRFIIHVGPHKTGTTYLQEAFAEARPKLTERGIHFPTVWGPVAHHALVDRLRNIPNPKLEAEFAALHAGKHQTVLISVEGLASLPEANVAYLRDLIGAENPVVMIYYVRAWADVLPSHWKESVKGGETETLPEYLYLRLQNPVTSSYVNFGVGLRIWAKLFGAEAIRLVAYNQMVEGKRDLFTHFAHHFLDWRDAPTPTQTAANVSPGLADIEVIRVLAALERMRVSHPLPRAYAPTFADHYLRRKADLLTPVLTKALEDHKASVVINETGQALMALHKALMSEFQQALVPPRLPNFFFRPRRAEIPYIHPNWLLAQGVMAHLRAVQEAVRADVEASGRRATPT